MVQNFRLSFFQSQFKQTTFTHFTITRYSDKSKSCKVAKNDEKNGYQMMENFVKIKKFKNNRKLKKTKLKVQKQFSSFEIQKNTN